MASSGAVDDDTSFLNSVIEKLYGGNRPVEECWTPKASEIDRLIGMSVNAFLSQESIIYVEPPITLVGDIHGQFRDLLALFKATGKPPETRYLFLGDYVDRGPRSVEVICLLLALKVRYPESVFLLRGNHESRCINRNYGFYAECVERYSFPVWNKFQDVFNVLPLCALVGERIFCVHGGLPRNIRSFDDIKRIRRPIEVPDEGIVCDLLWADPSGNVQGWDDNIDRGVGHVFGIEAVEDFCRRFEVDLIVRAHQLCQNGYEIFGSGRVITIFSAPNYAGCYSNLAAMLHVDDRLVCHITMFGSAGTEPRREHP